MKSKKVFVVSTGEYSDWRIRGVFSSREKAESFMATFNDKTKNTHWNENFNGIDVYEVDEAVNALEKGYMPYEVTIDKHGNVSQVDVDWSCGGDCYSFLTGDWSIYVWAKSIKHAVKIAADRRRQRIAETLPETTCKEGATDD